jgi:hypothetical protein
MLESSLDGACRTKEQDCISFRVLLPVFDMTERTVCAAGDRLSTYILSIR